MNEPSRSRSCSSISIPPLRLQRQPRALSGHALTVCAMFGIDPGSYENPVDNLKGMAPFVAGFRLPLPRGGIIFVGGPSGSGKSSLLRHIERTLENDERFAVVSKTRKFHSENAVIDSMATSLDRSLEALSVAGLAEAHDLLHLPHELSDGQRRRLTCARLFATAQACADRDPAKSLVVLIDEFCSTLDRLTACVIARNVRQWVSRAAITLIVATAHDDLLECLEPDVLIYKPLSEDVELHTRS